MPAHDDGATHTGGRRTQTSNGGNRGKGYVRRCGVGYRELSIARNFDFVAGGFSKNLGLEYVHNFGVMAQGLLTGENRFLSPCDFKELRVIKRARFTTSTLYQATKLLTLFCKATAAVMLVCLTELIREIGDGRGGEATAAFRGG